MVQLRKENFRRCLVQRLGEYSNPIPELRLLRKWVGHKWSLKGEVRISLLRGAIHLFDFEESVVAEMVLSSGLRMYKDRILHLDR